MRMSNDPEAADPAMTLVQSVERSFEVLEVVAARPAGISELARRVDLPTSTVARLLKTLEKLRVVDRDDDGAYRLGPKAMALATKAGDLPPGHSVDRARLTELAGQLGEIAGLSSRDGANVLYGDQADAPHDVQVRDWTGERVPLHVVSSGLVFLADSAPEAVDAYLRQDLKRFTTNTECDPQRIRDRLRETERVGYAWTNGEFRSSINSVAAPLRGPSGRVVAALHSHGPSYRFPSDGGGDRVAATLSHAALQISHELGWTGDLTTVDQS